MSEISVKKIISSFVELFNKKSVTNLDNFVSREIEYWDPSNGTVLGIDAIESKLAAFRIDNPKCIITIDVMVGKGDLVVAELSLRGCKTDKQTSAVIFTVVCTLQNGKIAKIKNYFNPPT